MSPGPRTRPLASTWSPRVPPAEMDAGQVLQQVPRGPHDQASRPGPHDPVPGGPLGYRNILLAGSPSPALLRSIRWGLVRHPWDRALLLVLCLCLCVCLPLTWLREGQVLECSTLSCPQVKNHCGVLLTKGWAHRYPPSGGWRPSSGLQLWEQGVGAVHTAATSSPQSPPSGQEQAHRVRPGLHGGRAWDVDGHLLGPVGSIGAQGVPLQVSVQRPPGADGVIALMVVVASSPLRPLSVVLGLETGSRCRH